MVRDIRDMFATASNNALEKPWTRSQSYLKYVCSHYLCSEQRKSQLKSDFPTRKALKSK